MTETFTIRRQVEFNHCDPAGIVFYPRYFEMISALIERFFTDAIDFSFAQLHLEGKMGVPMGHIEADFRAPSRLEDWLDLGLSVSRLGTASATFTIRCACEGQTRFEASATVVHADTRKGRSAPWPPAVRTALTRFLTEETQEKGPVS